MHFHNQVGKVLLSRLPHQRPEKGQTERKVDSVHQKIKLRRLLAQSMEILSIFLLLRFYVKSI